eukprot:CAMPEP_0197079666 /NCGR_PEP_ID=MMETSP1384-20130603/213739_1 /TAXON_ID=29189 /ORGANISM="Ammonia sp." /LENGTH=485 /DNA_ID=CAMNT_0042518543 /DNA_START=140 /DNA_END=1597 /DNA_ORIENTATION=-
MEQFWNSILYWCAKTRSDSCWKHNKCHIIDADHVAIYWTQVYGARNQLYADCCRMATRFKMQYNEYDIVGFIRYDLPYHHPFYKKTPGGYTRFDGEPVVWMVYKNINHPSRCYGMVLFGQPGHSVPIILDSPCQLFYEYLKDVPRIIASDKWRSFGHDCLLRQDEPKQVEQREQPKPAEQERERQQPQPEPDPVHVAEPAAPNKQPAIDNDTALQLRVQLVEMGFSWKAATEAAQMYPYDIVKAVEIASALNEDSSGQPPGHHPHQDRSPPLENKQEATQPSEPHNVPSNATQPVPTQRWYQKRTPAVVDDYAGMNVNDHVNVLDSFAENNANRQQVNNNNNVDHVNVLDSYAQNNANQQVNDNNDHGYGNVLDSMPENRVNRQANYNNHHVNVLDSMPENGAAQQLNYNNTHFHVVDSMVENGGIGNQQANYNNNHVHVLDAMAADHVYLIDSMAEDIANQEVNYNNQAHGGVVYHHDVLDTAR